MATLCPHCGRDTELPAANGSSAPAAQEPPKEYPNAAPKSDAIKHLYSMIMSGKAGEIKDFSKNIKIIDKLFGAQNEN